MILGVGMGLQFRRRSQEAPPVAPVAIAATNITDVSFSANWNAVVGATGYKLTVTDGGTPIPGFDHLDVLNVTTYSVTGLDANVAYAYYVNAYNGGGDGADSNTINVTTFDEDAQNIIDDEVTAGYSPSATERSGINTHILALKDPALDVWTSAHVIRLNLGNTAATCARNAAVIGANIRTAGGTITFGVLGSRGNGTTGTWNEQYNPNSAGANQNNYTVAVYNTTDDNVGRDVTCHDGTHYTEIISRMSNLCYGDVNDGTLLAGLANTDGTGCIITTRAAAGTKKVSIRGAITTRSEASTGVPNDNFYSFSFRSGGSNIQFTTKTQGYMGLFNVGLNDTKLGLLNTAINNLMVAFGRNV